MPTIVIDDNAHSQHRSEVSLADAGYHVIRVDPKAVAAERLAVDLAVIAALAAIGPPGLRGDQLG